MAYKPFTIVEGSGPFSKLCNEDGQSIRTGSVSCISGTGCYVRLLHTSTVTASGENQAMLDLPTGATFTDGWAYVNAGGSIPFGTERVADTATTEPVAQIDIYIDSDSTVSVLAH